MRAGSGVMASSTSGAFCAHSSGSCTDSSIGYMYIDSGRADWTSSVSMKSTNACAPSGFFAPSSTPAYSTCGVQESSITSVSGANAGEEE